MEPNFVIAGGQRSGTTSLVRILASHPQVYMARPAWPEPKYFVEDPRPGRDRAWYLAQWFADTGTARAVGEKSTSYLESPGAARRMKEQFPAMKVVMILRHPAERAISNYRFSRQNGLETLSLADALAEESQRAAVAGVSVSPFAYVRRGKYVLDLPPYFEYVPPSDRLMLLHDDLRADPAAFCRSLFEFLGVDPQHEPPEARERHNAHQPDELRIDRGTLDRLLAEFDTSNRELGKLLGRDLSAWSRSTAELEALVR
ncbi:MAG: sulfotransferase [Pirellulales bacterium]|nr:sulfotransferase [Pirellulales bacterium]